MLRYAPELGSGEIMLHRTSRSARQRGFTLVELLIVIGLIALLISLLIPALSRAREQSNRAKCLGNLRTIGQAMFLYASTYKDRLPNCNPPGVAVNSTAADKALCAFANNFVRSPKVF